MKIIKKNIKKILIIRTEHIGDYIVSLPAIKSVRENFPNAKIDLVVGPWNKELAEATPYIDEVILFDNPFAKRKINYFDIFKIFLFKSIRLLKFIKEINKRKYDLIIVFSNRKFNKLFLKLINSREKIFGDNWDDREVNQIKNCLNILESNGFKINKKLPKLSTKLGSIKKIDEILNSHNIKETFKVIIHPITPSENRNWKMDNWANLIEEISKKNKNLVFLLVGEEAQKDKINEIIKTNNKSINLAGELSLTELFLLCKKSKLFIGSCSGPLYIANLAGLPIVGIYSPESNKSWEPYGPNTKVIRKEDLNKLKVKEVFENFFDLKNKLR